MEGVDCKTGEKRKVLIVAYACEPNKTSEPGVGWNFTNEIAEFMDVTVLTRLNNRSSIEAEPVRKNIKYAYFDLPPFFTFLKKKVPLGLQLYFILWQFGAYLKLRKLTKRNQLIYDVCHHLTFGMTKMPPPGFLINKPFIWGPIGGGDLIPFPFLRKMGVAAIVQEFIYYSVHKFSDFSYFSYLTRRSTRAIIFRTHSSEENFPANGCKNRRVISETAFTQENHFSSNKRNDFISAVCVGRMIHGKGYKLALKGFHNFLKRGGEGNLVFLGTGPEEAALKSYVKKNNLSSSVHFKGFVANEEVHNILSEANIMIHPSFREGGSWSIMEAMSYGVPIICLNTSGPRDMVTENCGIMVAMDTPRQVVEDIGSGLYDLLQDPQKLQTLSSNASRRIREEYTWKKRGEQMESVYTEILSTI